VGESRNSAAARDCSSPRLNEMRASSLGRLSSCTASVEDRLVTAARYIENNRALRSCSIPEGVLIALYRAVGALLLSSKRSRRLYVASNHILHCLAFLAPFLPPSCPCCPCPQCGTALKNPIFRFSFQHLLISKFRIVYSDIVIECLLQISDLRLYE
jgi:hypothetical protein